MFRKGAARITAFLLVMLGTMGFIIVTGTLAYQALLPLRPVPPVGVRVPTTVTAWETDTLPPSANLGYVITATLASTPLPEDTLAVYEVEFHKPNHSDTFWYRESVRDHKPPLAVTDGAYTTTLPVHDGYTVSQNAPVTPYRDVPNYRARGIATGEVVRLYLTPDDNESYRVRYVFVPTDPPLADLEGEWGGVIVLAMLLIVGGGVLAGWLVWKMLAARIERS